MTVKIKDKEKDVIKHALETYLSDLRSEIVKTEKHDWKKELHREEDIIKDVVGRMN